MELALVRSPDTLASVAALPKPPFTVGFAAETEDVARYCAREARKEARRHDRRESGRPRLRLSDRETNALTVFWPAARLRSAKGTKPMLARRLIELIAERYRAGRHDARPSSRAG